MIEWMLCFEDSGEHVFQEGKNEGGIYFILEGEVTFFYLRPVIIRLIN